jgi:hypothetical protein
LFEFNAYTVHESIVDIVNCNVVVKRRDPSVVIPALYCAMRSAFLLKRVLFVTKLIEQRNSRQGCGHECWVCLMLGVNSSFAINCIARRGQAQIS